MGFLDRFFGKKRGGAGATAEDVARSQQLAGRETGQTADEQQAMRGRMEAEMDAQRDKRDRPAKPDA